MSCNEGQPAWAAASEPVDGTITQIHAVTDGKWREVSLTHWWSRSLTSRSYTRESNAAKKGAWPTPDMVEIS